MQHLCSVRLLPGHPAQISATQLWSAAYTGRHDVGIQLWFESLKASWFTSYWKWAEDEDLRNAGSFPPSWLLKRKNRTTPVHSGIKRYTGTFGSPRVHQLWRAVLLGSIKGLCEGRWRPRPRGCHSHCTHCLQAGGWSQPFQMWFHSADQFSFISLSCQNTIPIPPT